VKTPDRPQGGRAPQTGVLASGTPLLAALLFSLSSVFSGLSLKKKKK
jgi:LPXTG-motif cell wall-anchored protein